VSARYEFIDAEKATTTPDGMAKYSVVKMCQWLQVSTSGYYEWRGRPQSATAARREYLERLVAAIFDDSDQTYGYRRVHAQLTRQGERCSPELIRSIMRALGLVPCQPRPWRHGLTVADERPASLPDLVGRDFTAAGPGTKLVGDITYIPTW
jgi:putative transposase